ncbi:hypothetical protein [Streptomyces sp. NRRL S-1022]|uniref:hypothetical protein n=1 Tax=Streptomyces sp. NRRL S-1022 TaxID=1463880 RepID=UPI0004BF5264|nr:hypothetical protein [Streptomyces sp. NRRL S-1022]
MTTRETILRLPALLRICAQIVAPTGQHRARPHGAITPQEFVTCVACGGVETAATRHGTIVRCAEGHQQGGA